MIGDGLATLEVTINVISALWHAHRHLVVDSGFIPWHLLVVLWQHATKGQGKIVDIRQLAKGSGAVEEGIKYVTKAWEIPDDKADELRHAVFGRKRIWPLGDAQPVEIESVCPGCGKPTSECRIIDIGFADTLAAGVTGDGQRWTWVQMRHTEDRVLLLWTDGQWQVAQDINLIPMPFACHSPDQGGGPAP
jgi:hypothetical protein